MSTSDMPSRIMQDTARTLADMTGIQDFYTRRQSGKPLPSPQILAEIVERCRSVLFPGFYTEDMPGDGAHGHFGKELAQICQLLTRQIQLGLHYGHWKAEPTDTPHTVMETAEEKAMAFIKRLPAIRKVLATDIEAAYTGDPAAENYEEVLSCYPVTKALAYYRMAHELHKLQVPLIPRILTELAHSDTGIDIHPAAQIGHHFTIDHGTGVIIGATCIIGNHVKLYQGVTLGARSFPLDENEHPIKHIPRHPVIEDNVVVYSNATILGRVVIGRGAVIGGNVWLTHDVAPGTMVRQASASTRLTSGTATE